MILPTPKPGNHDWKTDAMIVGASLLVLFMIMTGVIR
jgi:hypothetical protein